MLCCPKCQMQYTNRTSLCEACNIPLVDIPPQSPNSDGPGENLDLTELAGFANVSEAEMIRELLEQNEIKTVVSGELDPIGIASRAEVTRLLVEKKDLLQAQEIYRAYFSGDAMESSKSDQDE
jgi:hypothetical protein